MAQMNGPEEYRRQQAFVEEQKSARLNNEIALMKMEEAQRSIERRNKFQATLSDIGKQYSTGRTEGSSGGRSMPTREYIDGQWVTVNDSFRGYNSPQESSQDYVQFLGENPRYGEYLNAGTMDAALEELGASGYATDPNYVQKLKSINPRTEEQAAFLEARKQELMDAGADPIRAEIGARQAVLETGWGKSLSGGNNYYGIKSHGKQQELSEEDAAVAQGLVEQREVPPEYAKTVAAAFAAEPNSDEEIRKQVTMLSFDFPEFTQEIGTSIAAIEDMGDAGKRAAIKAIEDDFVQRINAGEKFGPDMEEDIMGLAVLKGDVSDILSYMKSKNSASTAWDNWKPDLSTSESEARQLADNIRNNPALIGLDEETVADLDSQTFGPLGDKTALDILAENAVNQGKHIIGSLPSKAAAAQVNAQDLYIKAARTLGESGIQPREEDGGFMWFDKPAKYAPTMNAPSNTSNMGVNNLIETTIEEGTFFYDPNTKQLYSK
jgi:hypothetical protein